EIGQYPRDWFFTEYKELPWYQVYDVLEYVADSVFFVTPSREGSVGVFKRQANVVLEAEHSGYRFVNGILTEITHPAEIVEIERTAALAGRSGLEAVRLHIDKALGLLGKRPEPDYRNSIKEAISAVESATKLISGTRGAGVAPALDALSTK